MIYHEKPVTIASDSYCVPPGSMCVGVCEGEGGVLNNVLYGEDPRGGSNQKNTPFMYLERICPPFLYLKDKPKQ